MGPKSASPLTPCPHYAVLVCFSTPTSSRWWQSSTSNGEVAPPPPSLTPIATSHLQPLTTSLSPIPQPHSAYTPYWSYPLLNLTQYILCTGRSQTSLPAHSGGLVVNYVQRRPFFPSWLVCPPCSVNSCTPSPCSGACGTRAVQECTCGENSE